MNALKLKRIFRSQILWRSLRRGLAVFTLLSGLAGLYLWASTPLPDLRHLRERAAIGNTRILDRTGKLLYAVPDPLSGSQQPLASDQIPLVLQQATIAIEDTNFYVNSGIDLRGIVRAAWSNLRSGTVVAGGSTITQQLARSFLLDPQLAQQRSLERKLREAVLALKLSASLPKAEILALYLNQIYYGGLSYGVEAAAQHYFGKPARDLDLAEAALLAGLPQAPAHYDPFAQPAAALARQAQVLDAMARAGFISPSQATQAKAEPLQFSGAPTAMRAPHFVSHLLNELSAELGPDTLLRGGLTITTTLDADLQASAEATLRRQIAQLAAPHDGGPDHRVSNGAVVVLDPADGAILAMVGSPNFADSASQGQVNAALALRQPGSAIKPLTYAAALERGWTPATMILDVPTSFATREGRPYTPENYDRSYHGPLSLREALATSSNIAAVRTLESIGVLALLDMAARLGISSLSQDSGRYGLSLTLGSGEVSPLELTAAYAALANGGYRVAPYAVISISGPGGAALPATKLSASPRASAIAPQVAYLISDILADRYARMRAFGAESPLDIDRPAAVKTGTTSDWRDNWTVGYSPDRAVGVWVGNADGLPMQGISGISGAGPVWHAVMLAAHRGLAPRAFARPEGIVELAICADSGMLPSPNCPATRLERFIAGSGPQKADNTHSVVAVDRLLGCRAPAGYPASRTVSRIYQRLPPAAEAWAASAGLPEPPRSTCRMPESAGGVAPNSSASPLSPVVSVGADPLEPALIAPGAGAIFSISPGVPPERQQLMIQAQAGGPATRLAIVVDGATVASLSDPPYRVLWQLAPGTHQVWVEVYDSQGQRRSSPSVTFIVMP